VLAHVPLISAAAHRLHWVELTLANKGQEREEGKAISVVLPQHKHDASRNIKKYIFKPEQYFRAI